MTETLYRYEIQYSDIDSGTDVRCREYPVLRETESYYYVREHGHYGFEKKVKKNAYSTLAYDTKEKAREHFIRRTKKRIQWYEFWKKECERALEIIEEKSHA